MKKGKIKIAIVDDHQIVIDGLISLLDDNNKFSIQTYTTSAKKMLKLLDEFEVDVLLTDIMMPEMNGKSSLKLFEKIFLILKFLL